MLLKNNAERTSSSLQHIISRGKIVVKGIIIEVKSNTTLTVWGVPYNLKPVPHGGRPELIAQLPTPLSWNVVITNETRIIGNITQNSPVLVIGHIMVTNNSISTIEASNIIVYPFANIESNATSMISG